MHISCFAASEVPVMIYCKRFYKSWHPWPCSSYVPHSTVRTATFRPCNFLNTFSYLILAVFVLSHFSVISSLFVCTQCEMAWASESAAAEREQDFGMSLTRPSVSPLPVVYCWHISICNWSHPLQQLLKPVRGMFANLQTWFSWPSDCSCVLAFISVFS